MKNEIVSSNKFFINYQHAKQKEAAVVKVNEAYKISQVYKV